MAMQCIVREVMCMPGELQSPAHDAKLSTYCVGLLLLACALSAAFRARTSGKHVSHHSFQFSVGSFTMRTAARAYRQPVGHTLSASFVKGDQDLMV